MKTIFLFFTQFLVISTVAAQLSLNDIKYWIGNGPDSAALVIDFQDETSDPSYVWGYLFDASSGITAQNMVEDLSIEEPVLDIAAGGGIVNDIYFNQHGGTIGAPDFWETWTKNEAANWVLNDGLSETLSNGMFFGCSYTAIDSPSEPVEPIPAYASHWFTQNDIEFWVGEGSNEAVFVIDFIDDLNYGIPVRYAWGYRFDGVSDAEQMLSIIDATDENLIIEMSGGFLNSIYYIDQFGIGGDPNYWATFSGTNLSNWTLNAGISEPITDESWFGCTYAEWEPPRPFTPLPAVDPDSFLMSDVTTWIGSGSDSAVVVIDFNDGDDISAYAFGFLFDGVITGQDALNALEADLEDLTIDINGGFLNDIVFLDHIGDGGNPNYWATWSGTNIGGWALNSGITENISDGEWFGCSYSDFAPALPPNNPNNPILSIEHYENFEFNVYPNPSNGLINIETFRGKIEFVQIRDLNGRMLSTTNEFNGTQQIDLTGYKPGFYILSISYKNNVINKKICIK